MSMGDVFQVSLESNVKSNARNKPADFETSLARPVDLAREWEVAVIDLSYPYNGKFGQPIYIAILTDPTQDISELLVDNF